MKISNKKCDLNHCSFCRLCQKEWHPAIDASRQTLLLKKGEDIFKEGEKVAGVYFIQEGAARVHKKWGEKDLIIRFAKNGDILGHRGLGHDLVYPVSATALMPTSVCFISTEFFTASLKFNQDFMLHFLWFFADELKLSESRMRDLAHMPVRGRLAKALLSLKDKFGEKEGNIDLVLSKQDLASYTGATYETIFRVLNEMIEDKMVKVSNKSISILDEKKLVSIASSPA